MEENFQNAAAAGRHMTEDCSERLRLLREQIDDTDRSLLRLFEERMALCRTVAEVKRAADRPVFDAAREDALLRDRAQQSSCPEDSRALFNELLRASRALQRRPEEKAETAATADCDAAAGKPFGLLGREVSYSYSPLVHELLGDPDYRLFGVKEEALSDFLRARAFSGLNVTIPYKQAVIPYLDRLDARARAIGAVNTIRVERDGSLSGHNSDADGFLYALSRLGCPVRGRKVLLLGTGGAARTARVVLEEQGARVVNVSRSASPDSGGAAVASYDGLARHADAELLVNATPVGMHPFEGECLVDLDQLPQLKGVLDLVYNPFRTRLLLEAERRGIPCENGLAMLVAQALRSRDIWRGEGRRPLPASKLEPLIRQCAVRSGNLVLVGMPGSGKSTQARLLARRLNRPMYDTDEAFRYRYRLTPSQYIARYGIAAFREEETAVLRELSCLRGAVLSTGGGIVLSPQNRDYLRACGRVIFLDRPTEELALFDRPLSASPEALRQLEQERRPLYETVCDRRVTVSGTRRDTMLRILEAFES